MRRALAPFLTVLALAAGTVAADQPRRVVSMNVCTDQMAMLLAAPGQLVSISRLASDPLSSAMVEEAAAYPRNRGLAEEIYLLDPDLVLTGTFSVRATTDMLKRLGMAVAEFPPASTLDDVRANLIRMGTALGREAQAAALVAEFDARLAALRSDPASGPRAALYSPSGYTAGDASFSGEILAAAGFRNIAAEAGLPDGGRLPLEVLVLTGPDLVLTGQRYPGGSRAEAIYDHPALAAAGRLAAPRSRDWVCETPAVLDAIAALAAIRAEMEAGR